MSRSEFFSQLEAPPNFAPKPQDEHLEQRVSKLAEFAQKNGPPFVNMIKEKQRGNPEYSFLESGPGAEYFIWKLYCFQFNLSPDQPVQLQPGQAAPNQGHSQVPIAAPSAGPDARDIAWQRLRSSNDALPAEVEAAFTAILARLSGTRQSIKEGKEWFVAHMEHASGLAAKMAMRQSQLPGYEQQIHIIYLANDVLLKSLPQQLVASEARPESDVANAFQPALPLMIQSALTAGKSAAEVQQRLMTILEHWGSRGVYNEHFVNELKGLIATQQPDSSAASTFGPGVAAPAPAPGMQQASGFGGAPLPWPAPWNQNPSAQPGPYPLQGLPMPGLPTSAQWNQGPVGPAFPQAGQPYPAQQFGPPMPPTGFVLGNAEQVSFAPNPAFPASNTMHFQPGAVPLGGLLMPGWAPPPSLAHNNKAMAMPPPDLAGAPPGASEPPPTDPMGFPPGLLPALVKEHLRTEDNYVPLERKEVERAGIPNAAPADSYLLARLDKFHAEMQDYRPGTTRADLEDDQKRQRSRASLGGKSPPLTQKPSKELPSDGSYKGGQRDGGPAGLGFGEGYQIVSDDPFSQYRKKRSGFYHESIAKSSTATSGPQAAH